MNALRSERGSIVLGGLTKLVLVFVVLGAVVYDGVAIGYTHFSTADHGALAADHAGETWRNTSDITQAYEAAKASLKKTGEKIDPKSFTIDPETDTVSFQLTAHAPTLVAQRIPWTEPMTVIKVRVVTESAAPSS